MGFEAVVALPVVAPPEQLSDRIVVVEEVLLQHRANRLLEVLAVVVLWTPMPRNH